MGNVKIGFQDLHGFWRENLCGICGFGDQRDAALPADAGEQRSR